jgi:sn-glycerol 3-phosphate transport system permease protein
MQTKRTLFRSKTLPYLLILPQMVVTIVFFLWPAGQAVRQSFMREDAFGFKTTFVWFDNYIQLFSDPTYENSLRVTLVFAVGVAVLSLVSALILALAVDRTIRSSQVYTTLLVWPYAVAPAVAGI